MGLNWNEIKSRALLFSKTWADASNEDSEAKPFWIAFFEIFGITDKRVASIGTSKTKTVTAFDNLIVLPRFVPLRSLQRLNCGEAHQLISTRPITSEQLNAILSEALPQ